MTSQKINILTKTNFINFLIMIIPASYIAGNLILNLNVVLLILGIFFLYKTEVFKIKYSFLDKIIFLIFFYILINGIYNNFFNFNFPNAPDQNLILKKSILYLRYLLLYIVLRFFITRGLINFKLIFISFGLCSLFVSLDVIFQYFVGYDLFGFKADGRRMGGPFGSELIAGSFIQRF